MDNYKKLLAQYLLYQENHTLEGAPDELYDPANYILSLGGKRVRPLLALLGYQLTSSDITPALPLAHAVEVFHNFTLMHDDIMDNADVRRGQPTVHLKWNPSIAILSGDMMLVKAYQFLTSLNCEPTIKNQIIEEFGLMAEAVCVGQQWDMNFEGLSDVTESNYLSMIEGKTSVLLAFSLKSGGMLAGLPETDTDSLYQYGLNIGLAFQVMDDYLDTFGNKDNFGKRIGGDIIENKKTLLWIEAKKRATESQSKQLASWYLSTEDSNEKIEAVTSLYKELKVDDYAKDLMMQYFEKASTILIDLENRYDVSNLRSLATDLNTRTS